MSGPVWKKYFEDTYLKVLEETRGLISGSLDSATVCAGYVKLFRASCTLLKFYMAYNGLFQFENREIIREAFYIELIKDGDIWINALSLVEAGEIQGFDRVEKMILSYCSDEFFHIFDDLKAKFEGLYV